MSLRHVRYLLIGGGLASSAAAAAIRERDADGTILLVAGEIVRPYNRPPLSKEFLRREKLRASLFTVDSEWFNANRIELRTGRRALHLDAARSLATLDNGDLIRYDRLLLATGMSARPLDVPGAHLPNLFYLRTLHDAELLQHAVDKATREGLSHEGRTRSESRGRAVVIGAGVLGVELASSLTQLGMRVDLLCGHPRPWHKFAGENVAQGLVALLEKRGVHVHLNTRPLRLEGDGRVQHVVLPDGTVLDCDFSVAAVGANLNRELLRATPIAAESGILVDSRCQTNLPNIFAAGDCAAIFDPLFGKYRMLDHWDHASVTGKLAGANMAGGDKSYDGVNYFFSEAFGLGLSGWGEARLVNRRVVRNARANGDALPDIVEFGIAADGRICQILALGHPADHDFFRAMIVRRAVVLGQEEMLKDPTIELTKILI